MCKTPINGIACCALAATGIAAAAPPSSVMNSRRLTRSPRRRARAGRRQFDSDRPRRLEVDHQLELGRLLDWKIAGTHTFEDLVNQTRGATVQIRVTDAVGHESADID